VTGRRLRDLRRLLQAEAEPHGAVGRIERTGGSHLKATFDVAGRQTFIITSWSPSTWRFGCYVRAEARRALRELAGAS
jgi:hypothetical protein